ncbi:hypothetical protein Plhal304r1_c004g0016181 [Plasmopara halstedii]
MLAPRPLNKHASSQSSAAFCVLTANTINPNIVKAEYAVRARWCCALTMLEQKPIEFHRQVLALVNVPGMVDRPEAQKLFPPDAIARAKFYIDILWAALGLWPQ